MNGHVNNSVASNQKNSGGNGSRGKNSQNGAHNNKKFIQMQEERLRQISNAKQKEGKVDPEDGEVKTQEQKRSRRRHNRNRQK
mmetsp:Transcript_27573/g.39480  ORF Transcript_27573/g.39480 Transcript_27573/m.39480 type:complete len:83 (-) Transcript_27573:171-419(-)